MLYFTADLHLCHDDMRKIRGFQNTDEMNEYIISCWNDTVEEDDDIYVLGDIVCGSPINAECYLKRLKGRKHFLIGNHDFGWMRKTPNYKDYFVSVKNIEYMFLDDAFLTLCHYPLLEWPGSSHFHKEKSYLIHGHIHSSRTTEAFPIIRDYLPDAYNCGVDINNFKPVTFDELVENNKKWYGRK